MRMSEPSTPKPGPSRGLAALAGAVLLAGVLFAAWQWRNPGRPAEPPPSPADPVGEDVIRHALSQAGLESAEKSRWVDQVPGVELSELPPDDAERFLRFANAQRCTCDCGYTLAACRNFDSDCDVSLPRARALFDSVRRGLAGSARGLRERPGEAAPPPARRR